MTQHGLIHRPCPRRFRSGAAISARDRGRGSPAHDHGPGARQDQQRLRSLESDGVSTSANVEPGSMRNDTRSSAGTLTPRLSNTIDRSRTSISDMADVAPRAERNRARHARSARGCRSGRSSFVLLQGRCAQAAAHRGAVVHGRLAWLRLWTVLPGTTGECPDCGAPSSPSRPAWEARYSVLAAVKNSAGVRDVAKADARLAQTQLARQRPQAEAHMASQPRRRQLARRRQGVGAVGEVEIVRRVGPRSSSSSRAAPRARAAGCRSSRGRASSPAGIRAPARRSSASGARR